MPSLIRNERGVAMAAAIFMLVVFVAITVAALHTSQGAIVTSRNYQHGSQGLYAAEAGIAHALALINQAGVSNLKNDVLDKWSGGQAPFASHPQLMAQQQRFNYEVTIVDDPAYPDANHAIMTSTGRGTDGALRIVSAHVTKSGEPLAPPGAIYLANDGVTNAEFVGNSFRVEGNDRNLDGTVGPEEPVPGISTLLEANAQEVRDALSNSQKDNVQGLGYTADPLNPSVSQANGPSEAQISQLIDDLLDLPHTTYNDSDINGNASFGICDGSTIQPQISYFSNESGTTIKANGNASGCGVLIVEHGLTIKGTLDFVGLILVRGYTSIEQTEATGNASVQGSIWTTDLNLKVGGSAIVQYSSQALKLANQSGGAGTSVLPAPVVITAWRDEF